MRRVCRSVVVGCNHQVCGNIQCITCNVALVCNYWTCSNVQWCGADMLLECSRSAIVVLADFSCQFCCHACRVSRSSCPCPSTCSPVLLPITCPLHAPYMPITCPSHAHHMSITCPLLAHYLPITCPLLSTMFPGLKIQRLDPAPASFELPSVEHNLDV